MVDILYVANKRLDGLLHEMVKLEGSDLHMKVGSPPRVRCHGTLQTFGGHEVLKPADTSEMAAAITPPHVLDRFENGGDVDFAYGIPGFGRFRVNAFRQRGSVAMVFRAVRTNSASFEELGLPDVVGRMALEHRGLVLVTGPTGSGKTTTLAAMIDHINENRPCNIITIEDPIEVLHSDKLAAVSQREVGIDVPNFSSAMRGAMRQDPDVIFVGEMRDEETVSAALAAAETGHLVLSTLHTIDAMETISRIVDFFPPYQQHQVRASLAGVLRGTICQRLVVASDGSSRVPAVEVMIANGRIQQCIIEPDKGGEIHEIIADGEYYGMQTFDQSLVKLIANESIDVRSAMSAATKPQDLKIMLQQRGLLATARPRAV
ncbi:MAG: type IV pilus twitching motility protein PilT [Acidimicrobiales bacterium]